MKDRKLATRYARALLGLLPENPAAESAERFLSALGQAMQQSPDTQAALLDPAIPRARRKQMLEAIAAQHAVPKEVGRFLSVIVDHNRTAAIPEIAVVFAGELDRRSGILTAEMTTARPMSDDDRERARQGLERATGKRVRLTFKVEPALVGGAVTRVGSRVFDGSVRSHLARLGARMTQG